jgi:hypothetical protein
MAGYLFAAWLSRILLRRLEHFNPGRMTGGSTEQSSEAEANNGSALSVELRDEFLCGQTDYSKYGRAERRTAVAQMSAGFGGSILVIGERGIGKDAFISQLGDAVDGECVFVDCSSARAADVIAQISVHLELGENADDPKALAAALEAKDIRMIGISNMHLLVRPVVGGFGELQQLVEYFDLLPARVARLCGVDRFAWQYIKCALAEQVAGLQKIVLPAWNDEQIDELIGSRCAALGIEPDYTNLKLPTQYLEASYEDLQERNKHGIHSMVASLSAGNPTIALRLFINCISVDEHGKTVASLPQNADARGVEQAPISVLLTLRTIAQAERVTVAELVSNLRYPEAVVVNALRIALVNGWVVLRDEDYSLSWAWFRTVTRVLARQNLLAGVRQADA